MKISDILSPSCILLGVEAKNKQQVLDILVDAIAQTGHVADKNELARVIAEREKLMSTGIGHGVALPHGKSATVSRSVAALATMKTPIDFDALDDQPVNIVLMLVGTEGNVGVHLRLLSRISRMVGTEQFRSRLIAAPTVESVLDLFAEYEEDKG